jgi:hypothetical protein
MALHPEGGGEGVKLLTFRTCGNTALFAHTHARNKLTFTIFFPSIFSRRVYYHKIIVLACDVLSRLHYQPALSHLHAEVKQKSELKKC